MHHAELRPRQGLTPAEQAEAFAAQAAAALQVAPRPSLSAVRTARHFYLRALGMLEPARPLGPAATSWLPLRRLSQRVDRLIWRGRLKRWATSVRRAVSLRTWLFLGLATAGAASVPVAWELIHPNVLAGIPPKPSSEWARCEPRKKRCAGAETRILFHTNEEPNPFVQYDLGRTVKLRRVEVTNRRDANSERAVPLLIFTSLDGTTWREVARRDYWFETFRADFAKTETRYLKLQVGRRSMLHLEAVRAWE